MPHGTASSLDMPWKDPNYTFKFWADAPVGFSEITCFPTFPSTQFLVLHLHSDWSSFVETENAQLLRPYLQQMMEGVLTVSTQYSSEVLALSLETVCSLVSVSSTFFLTRVSGFSHVC